MTTQDQAEAVRGDLPAALRRSVLVEPRIRNTAACITLAAVALATHNPQQVMVVVPADHWVGDATAYRRAIRAAIGAAVSQDTIATIGIRPTQPHTGLGYLCAGAPIRGLSASLRAFRLARFVEKPSRGLAQQLLRRPRTYWNTGTFVGTADKFLECVTEWLPDHTRRLVPLASVFRRSRGHPSANGFGTGSFIRQAEAAYRAVQPVSFDHGVMDHLHRGVVVEGRFPWADLGSWDVWARLGSASSRIIPVDSANVTVVSQEPHLVATVGVRDLVVIHTPTATLICRADRAQSVRDVVKRLAADPRLASYR